MANASLLCGHHITYPRRPAGKTRSPMQMERNFTGSRQGKRYRSYSPDAGMLAITGVLNVHLDLGHVGIYRALSRQAGLTELQESELFDVLQRKADLNFRN